MTEPKNQQPTKKQLDYEDEYRDLQLKTIRIANNKTLAEIKINRQALALEMIGSYEYDEMTISKFDKYKEAYIKAYKLLENL